jgi:hypothetical protein
MSCGCKQVDEDHGDSRNITMSTLRQAAEAAGISADEAARNISASVGEPAAVGAGYAGDGNPESESPNGQKEGSAEF